MSNKTSIRLTVIWTLAFGESLLGLERGVILLASSTLCNPRAEFCNCIGGPSAFHCCKRITIHLLSFFFRTVVLLRVDAKNSKDGPPRSVPRGSGRTSGRLCVVVEAFYFRNSRSGKLDAGCEDESPTVHFKGRA